MLLNMTEIYADISEKRVMMDGWTDEQEAFLYSRIAMHGIIIYSHIRLELLHDLYESVL